MAALSMPPNVFRESQQTSQGDTYGGLMHCLVSKDYPRILTFIKVLFDTSPKKIEHETAIMGIQLKGQL